MLHCGTLHGFALKALSDPHLRHNGQASKWAGMKIVGDKDYEQTIKATLKILNLRMPVSAARDIVANNTGFAGNDRIAGLAVLRAMENKGSLHPDMLLSLLAMELAKGETRLPQGVRLYVDEFQDTATIDAVIYRSLQERHGARFFIVGDPRQAIFGFRGGSAIHLQQALERADGTATLNVNYRSTAEICDLGNAIAKRMPIPEEMREPIVSAAPAAIGSIDRHNYSSSEEEALAIARYIQEAGITSGTAILTRYNVGVRTIANVLRAAKIPVTATTDTDDLKEELRDQERLTEWIRHIPDNDDPIWWRDALAGQQLSMAMQDRLAGPMARARTADERVAILSDLETPQQEHDVWVGTIHAAKGLEWDTVWIAGADNRSFDTSRADHLCLAFVAATRAKRVLRISSAESRQAERREVGLRMSEIFI